MKKCTMKIKVVNCQIFDQCKTVLNWLHHILKIDVQKVRHTCIIISSVLSTKFVIIFPCWNLWFFFMIIRRNSGFSAIVLWNSPFLFCNRMMKFYTFKPLMKFMVLLHGRLQKLTDFCMSISQNLWLSDKIQHFLATDWGKGHGSVQPKIKFKICTVISKKNLI